MSRRFTYQPLPARVLFGAGVLAELPGEIESMGLRRVLVLSSPSHGQLGRRVLELLGGRGVGLLAEARMHVPVEVARRARERAAELGADGCVAVGGGSAIGLGKAVALEHGLPVVAVPSTYAGSEMTPVWGLTEHGRKRTGRDPRVLPRAVLYDPDLTLTLPAQLSVTSGMNAIAHATEGLYAPDLTPVVALMAEEGARALAGALPAIVADGGDVNARAEAQFGAWLCGSVLGATTMSLHHKLCHILGGALDLPHAPTHTVLLPHVLAYNAPAASEAVAALRRAFGSGDPARWLWQLGGRLGAPRSLADLGMAEGEIPRLAQLATAQPYPNPRPVTAGDVERLLQAAWRGDEPSAADASSAGGGETQ